MLRLQRVNVLRDYTWGVAPGWNISALQAEEEHDLILKCR